MNWRVPARTRARHAGHGGNAGGQVVGTILASGKLEAKDGAKAVIKTELQVAVIVGIVMTLCSAPALHVNFYAPPPVHLYEPVRTCTNLSVQLHRVSGGTLYLPLDPPPSPLRCSRIGFTRNTISLLV